MILRGWSGSTNMSANAMRSGLLFGTNDMWEPNWQGDVTGGTNNQDLGKFLLWFEVEDTGCGTSQPLVFLHLRFSEPFPLSGEKHVIPPLRYLQLLITLSTIRSIIMC